jgi:hypothetical protein
LKIEASSAVGLMEPMCPCDGGVDLASIFLTRFRGLLCSQ